MTHHTIDTDPCRHAAWEALATHTRGPLPEATLNLKEHDTMTIDKPMHPGNWPRRNDAPPERHAHRADPGPPPRMRSTSTATVGSLVNLGRAGGLTWLS